MSTPRFQLVPGGRLRAAGTGAGGVGWRLLGANNRELGRSASTHEDAEAAHRAIAQLPSVLQDAPAHVGHNASTSLWTWWVEGPDGEPVAISGRGFRHERECRYNLAQFCDVAPQAPTSATSIPAQPSWWHADDEHESGAAVDARVVELSATTESAAT